MLTATDRLEVDKHLFSSCVYKLHAVVCLFFVMKLREGFVNLSKTRELVTEIVFVMRAISSIFPLENFHPDSSYQC